MPAVVGFDEDALPPSPEEVRYFLFYLFLGCFIVIKTLRQMTKWPLKLPVYSSKSVPRYFILTLGTKIYYSLLVKQLTP